MIIYYIVLLKWQKVGTAKSLDAVSIRSWCPEKTSWRGDADKVHVGAINASRSHHADTENLAGDGGILAVNNFTPKNGRFLTTYLFTPLLRPLIWIDKRTRLDGRAGVITAVAFQFAAPICPDAPYVPSPKWWAPKRRRRFVLLRKALSTLATIIVAKISRQCVQGWKQWVLRA